jgi:hypothetical protein
VDIILTLACCLLLVACSWFTYDVWLVVGVVGCWPVVVGCWLLVELNGCFVNVYL